MAGFRSERWPLSNRNGGPTSHRNEGRLQIGKPGRFASESADPAAALFLYSRDRSGEHPRQHLAEYAGILQADAYAGFSERYDAKRQPGPITEAACWAHGRRKLFVLADVAKAPLALEAVRRIDAIFVIEQEINGLSAVERIAAARGPPRSTP